MSHVPDEIMQKAIKIVASQNTNEYPEDDWHGISDEWDLNMYIDMDDKPAAVLYPVVNGNTNTETGYPVSMPTKM